MSFFSSKSKDQMKVFRLYDFLTFGMVGVLADGIMAYFLVNGLNLDAQKIALMIVVGLAFWVPYVVLLLGRLKFTKSISYVTRQGLPVVTNGFDAKQADVEAEIDRTIKLWDAATGKKIAAEAIQTLFIEFKHFPVYEEGNMARKFAGLLKNKWALVGYKPDLQKTALAHELGHEIHYKLVGYYDNEECHKYMAEHHLP